MDIDWGSPIVAGHGCELILQHTGSAGRRMITLGGHMFDPLSREGKYAAL